MAHHLPAQRFDPIFPVTDMKRAQDHYTALGFTITRSGEDGYAFAIWENVGCIHLARVEDFDPKKSAGAAYFHVPDADALAKQWDPLADVRQVVTTDYGKREGAVFDPDNNLIRFGSPL